MNLIDRSSKKSAFPILQFLRFTECFIVLNLISILKINYIFSVIQVLFFAVKS